MSTAVRTYRGTSPEDRKQAQLRIFTALEDQQEQMIALAPKGYEADYFFASLKLYCAANPRLLDCHPVSVAQAMLRVAQTGLELGVSCDILPFESGKGGPARAQFNPRTNGLVELMLKAGVRSVNFGVVRAGDEFRFVQGAPPTVHHVPAERDRGAILRAWSAIETKLGSFQITVMNREEIDAIRRQFSKSWWQKSGEVIPLEDIPWYAAKTVLRQGAKYAPKSPRLAAALRYDPAEEVEIEHVSPVPALPAEDLRGEVPSGDRELGEEG